MPAVPAFKSGPGHGLYILGRIEKHFFWKFISPRGDYCVVGQYKTQEKNGF